ncbi:MAG: transposase [Saprospiraceae bacterium]
MSNKIRKRWSFKEKVEILSSYQREGITRTIRQYGVSGTMIYKWQKAFEADGEEGLTNAKQRSKDIRLAQLERENQELKSIVAEKELQLRIQEEVIKKNHLLRWKR